MPQWARTAGKLLIAIGGAIADTVRPTKPPLRIEDLHVGATTEGVREAERAKAEAKWPGSTGTVFLDEPPPGGTPRREDTP